MRLQQLQCLCEIARQGLSVSRAADALHTSQPAVSRQLAALERELGVHVFVRNNRRLTGVTPAGRAIIATARRMLADAENLAKIGRDFTDEDTGSLTVATTHTQARYALPGIVKRFIARHPGVRLTLRQGNPAEIAGQVAAGEADLCIGSEPPVPSPALVTLPCNELHRIVLTPLRHPLLREKRVTLESLARYPIITYDFAFVGRSRLLRAFEAKGIAPNIVLSAIDTDVIKHYVECGLGIAIVADMAYEPGRDSRLRAVSVRHLFESNTIYIGIRRNDYLRGYVFDFIEMFAPQLRRRTVEKALAAPAPVRGQGAAAAGSAVPRATL